MKTGNYTTELPVEIEINGEYKEFNVLFSANWQNDGIGRYEFGSAVCFDKGTDYLEQIQSWEVIGEISEQEKSVLENYILDNGDKILKKMSEDYDPYWDCQY